MGAPRIRLGRLLLAVAVGASLWATAGPDALADDASQARFHYELASQHYASGELREAIREFFLVQDRAPNPHILYNIALAFDALGQSCHRRSSPRCDSDRQQAFHWFSVFVRDTADTGDAARREHAQEVLRRLAQRVARVRVESDPPGAEIYVDRRELGSFGVTPVVLPLAAGEHTLTLELPGYESAQVTVDAQIGHEAESRAALRLIQGELHVTAPAESEARVFDADDGIVAHGPTPLSARLAPGTYRVEVQSPDALPWRDLAVVQADETRLVAAEPEALPAPTADLTVTANAAGAVVEVDGTPSGFTPAVLSRLSVGRHRVRLEHPGLQPFELEVVLEAEERGWLTASLEPPASISRSPATWILGTLGAGSLIAGGVMGVMSKNAHDGYISHLQRIDSGDTPPTDLSAQRARGRRLGRSADAMMGAGVLTLAVATLVYFLTERTESRASSGSFSRGVR